MTLTIKEEMALSLTSEDRKKEKKRRKKGSFCSVDHYFFLTIHYNILILFHLNFTFFSLLPSPHFLKWKKNEIAATIQPDFPLVFT